MFLLLAACATTGALHADAAPLSPSPVIVAPDEPIPVGSLWSEVGGRALIGMDNNARRTGDLITVLVNESASTSIGAATDLSRQSEAEAGITALLGAETAILNANAAMGGKIGIGGSSGTSTSGDGKTSRTGALTAVVTCHVVEVLNNGNLRIRGTKEVRVNRETQYLTLEGVIRPRDIRLDNTVQSNLIAEARVEFTGEGAIASQQGQGWGNAVTNAVWPF